MIFCQYGDSPRIVAVGWLERGHAYPVGEVSAEVYAKLEDLLVAPWQPAPREEFDAAEPAVAADDRLPRFARSCVRR